MILSPADQIAISSASRASSARSESDTCQPTILRENRSVTNEVYTKPRAVSTYVISATRRLAGEAAVKSRSSRSDGRGVPAGAGTVVRRLLLPGRCARDAQLAHQPLER